MFKWVLVLMLGVVIGAESVHVFAHKDMDMDPHSFCQSRFPELRIDFCKDLLYNVVVNLYKHHDCND